MSKNKDKGSVPLGDNKPSYRPDFSTTHDILPNLMDGERTQVGPYKILGLLGEGGFALVYLAEQNQPVKRRVALKIIKPGMDTKQVIVRFEAERQALALLDHPNIAQVYDAGTTEAGRPYFVMEYIKGISITRHCDEHKLSIEERLELFLQVCDGVQHAHQKGIIHRDIKPSNILVMIDGKKSVPKIIDFGVAKAITQPLTERTLFTELGQLIGTPEYMSPEQAEVDAQDIDTRSDIYSLGALLYEILTGTVPFDRKTLQQAGFAGIQRVIREEDPPHPSTRLSSLGEEATKIAACRCTEVAALTKRLRKELEWIPLKAMRKERGQRYRSASELSDDIKNYLNGAPLIAGPASIMYRTKKFLRRNRALVANIIVVFLLIVTGIGVAMAFVVGQERGLRKAAEQKLKVQAIRYLALEGYWLDNSIPKLFTNPYEDPEKQFNELVETSKRAYGIEHPDTLTYMNYLAEWYRAEGRYDKAEPLLIQVYEGRNRVLGYVLDTKNSLDTLIDFYEDWGKPEEARKWEAKRHRLPRRKEIEK